MNNGDLEYRLLFQCLLEEDLHSGSGQGRLKAVDDLHARDRNGLPVVWHTTLHGLLRNSAEKLAARSDDCAHSTIRDLFGAEGGENRSQLVCRSLHFSPPTETDSPHQLFHVSTSTSRETFSRRPQDETLRTIEYASAGLQTGQVELRLRGSKQQAELVEKCLKRLTHLGGGKTRGAGQIRLLNLKHEEINRNNHNASSHPAADRLRLRLLLKNLEPLNIPATGYPGNILATETHLPGQMLRGAWLTALTNRGSEAEATRLADESGPKFLNAYPFPSEIPTGIQDFAAWDVLPLPLTAQEAKATERSVGKTDVPWWATLQEEQQPWLTNKQTQRDTAWLERDSPSNSSVTFKRVKHPYYLASADGNAYFRIAPEVSVVLRNRTIPSRQDRSFDSRRENYHPSQDQGGDLFSEEVLVEDQTFLAEILFTDQQQAEDFSSAAADFLEGPLESRAWLRVGRGGRPVVVEKYEWLSTENKLKSAIPGEKKNEFVLTLTSDLIVRRPDLSFAEELTPEVIAELCGDTVQVQDISDASVSETRLVHGFNTAARSRRMAVLAIARGSAFRVICANEEACKSRVEALQAHQKFGLGERTTEGYGRFAINHPSHLPAESESKLSAAPRNDLQASARLLREETLRKVFNAVKEMGLSNLTDIPKQFPGRSQWQRLRHRAEVVKSEPMLAAILKELETSAGKLSGRMWENLHSDLVSQVNKAASGDDAWRQRRIFLIYFCRYIVTQLDRKQASDRSKEQGANA